MIERLEGEVNQLRSELRRIKTGLLRRDIDDHLAVAHVTGGDAHDHSGGDGAQIDHGGLAGLTDDDHSLYLNDTRHNRAHSMLRAVRASSAQTISDATTTTLIFNSVQREDDEDGDFSLNTSTGVLTINNAGWYQFSAGVRWDASFSSSNRMLIRLKVNSTVIAQQEHRPGDPNDLAINLATAFYCSASDTVVLEVYHDDSGSSSRTVLNDALTFLTVQKVRE